MICGRNSRVRAVAPSTRPRISRISAATTSPAVTGTRLKKMIK
jgi:hypothetical protein